MSEIKRLRELLAEATPGPWRARKWGSPRMVEVLAATKPPIVPWPGFDDSSRTKAEHDANADLIAAAVNALPGLLDERDALRAALYNCGLAAQSGAQAMSAHKRGGWEKHRYIMETARAALDRPDAAS